MDTPVRSRGYPLLFIQNFSAHGERFLIGRDFMFETTNTIPAGKFDTATTALYNENDVRQIAAEAVQQAMIALLTKFMSGGQTHLENNFLGTTDNEGDNNMSVERRKVIIGTNEDGSPVYKWLKAASQDEMNDCIVEEYIKSGRINKFIKPSAPQTVREEIPDPVVTFGEYAEQWMKLYKVSTCKQSTIMKYSTDLKTQILPAFSTWPVSKITTNDIQKFLNDRKDKAAKSLRGYRALIKQILDSAKEDGLITINPADSQRIQIPSKKKDERIALPLDDFKEILHQADSLAPADKHFLVLLMFTGMRRGEALGLRWEDIDVANNLIHIRRSVTHPVGNQPIVGTTKTDNGARDIPLDPYLLEVLKPLKKNGYIIGDKKPYTMTKFNTTWKRIKKKIDLHGATPHVLRHSYLTYLHSAGASDKTLQTIAGHSQISTTLNIYVHSTKDDVAKAGETMHKVLCA